MGVAATSSGDNLTKEEMKSCTASDGKWKKRTCGPAVKAGIMVLTYAHYSDSSCTTLTGGPNKHAYNYCSTKSSGSKKSVVTDGKIVEKTYTSADCSGASTTNNVTEQAPTDGSCWASPHAGLYQVITLDGTSASTNTASQSSSFAGSILAGALGFIYAVMA